MITRAASAAPCSVSCLTATAHSGRPEVQGHLAASAEVGRPNVSIWTCHAMLIAFCMYACLHLCTWFEAARHLAAAEERGHQHLNVSVAAAPPRILTLRLVVFTGPCNPPEHFLLNRSKSKHITQRALSTKGPQKQALASRRSDNPTRVACKATTAVLIRAPAFMLNGSTETTCQRCQEGAVLLAIQAARDQGNQVAASAVAARRLQGVWPAGEGKHDALWGDNASGCLPHACIPSKHSLPTAAELGMPRGPSRLCT